METPNHDNDKRESQRRAFLAAAKQAGCVAPEDALALAGELPAPADGADSVKSLDGVIATMREQRPWLFAPTASPGLAQRAPDGESPGDLLRRTAQASGLTRDIQRWRESRRR